MGIMRNQLLYVTQYDGIHRDRATTAPWWGVCAGDAGQIHMAYDAGKDYNFDSLRYIFHQAGSSIKAYLTIMDGDLEPLLQGVRMSSLNDRQTELVRSARKNAGNGRNDKSNTRRCERVGFGMGESISHGTTGSGSRQCSRQVSTAQIAAVIGCSRRTICEQRGLCEQLNPELLKPM